MQNTHKIVRQGQCFLDKVLELTGSLENSMKMVRINDVSVTQDLDIGMSIIPDGKIKRLVVETWKKDGPATAISIPTETKLEGISVWAINDDFVIGG